MTLVELSVAILVLLFFLGMMFIGVRAWKRGSDRAACILNIYKTQNAVRSFANMNGLSPGVNTSKLSNPIDVKANLVGPDGYIASEPVCPAEGTYSYGGNVIPEPGALYLSCSLALESRHVPASHGTW